MLVLAGRFVLAGVLLAASASKLASPASSRAALAENRAYVTLLEGKRGKQARLISVAR
jgi:hypothetical protein